MPAVNTIAVIGATEKAGAAIVRKLAKNSFRLLLIANEHDKAVLLKTDIENEGAKAELFVMGCAREASWEADIIILATPCESEKEVAEKIRPVATGKVVISICHPLGRHFKGVATSSGRSAAEELQKLLPYSKIVKTFTTTSAAGLLSPVIDGKDTELFIAGNSGDAVDAVAVLMRSIGFHPVVVGDLTISGTLETMQPEVITLALENRYAWLPGRRPGPTIPKGTTEQTEH